MAELLDGHSSDQVMAELLDGHSSDPLVWHQLSDYLATLQMNVKNHP
jgi:hypothetical protein